VRNKTCISGNNEDTGKAQRWANPALKGRKTLFMFEKGVPIRREFDFVFLILSFQLKNVDYRSN
jgi:hypothetical protein